MAQNGAPAEETEGARNGERDAEFPVLDHETLELHAIGLGMCDEIAETMVSPWTGGRSTCRQPLLRSTPTGRWSDRF